MADEARLSEALVRDVGDYLNHVSTLSAGSIVVLATFSSRPTGGHGVQWAVGAVILFALTILSAVLSKLAVIITSHFHDADADWWVSVAGAAIAIGLVAFGLGVAFLGIYTAVTLM